MPYQTSNNKPYQQLIHQLKSEGLIFTEQTNIKLPKCQPPPASMINKLFSVISSQQKKYEYSKSYKRIWPLQQKIILVSQFNTISIYQINKSNHKNTDLLQKQQISAKLRLKFHMQQNIHKLIFMPMDIKKDDINFIIIYEQSNLISLFTIRKYLDYLVQLKQHIRVKGKVLALNFITVNQFMVVDQMYEACRYKISKDMISKMGKLGKVYESKSIDNQVIFANISGQYRQQQQTTMNLFLGIFNSFSNKGMITVRQFTRQLSGSMSVCLQSFQLCTSYRLSIQQLNSVGIVFQKDYFFLSLGSEIYIITKHFKKYVLLDVIMQKIGQYDKFIVSDGVPLICGMGNENVEIWEIQVKNKKAGCKLVDFIAYNNVDGNGVINLINGKQKQQKVDRANRQIGLLGVAKIDKVTKLVDRISKASSKNQIVSVQNLGKKLGVDRKSLYLRLWKNCTQSPQTIHQYLLQCYDLTSIHIELEKYMRRHAILTGELLKILQEIQAILLQKLVEELDIKSLKWFLKTNFQRRKLNFYDFNTQITFKEFQQIYNSSIYELIQKNIDKRLFPQKLQSKIFWQQNPYEQPQINILQILQEFKLLILENYEQFLLTLLKNGYKYNIADVMGEFHLLLPKHPFTMEVFKQNTYENREKVLPLMFSSINYYNSIYSQQRSMVSKGIQIQKAWFSEVTQEDWGREKSSSDYVYTKLYHNYPTHLINGLIDQLKENQWNKKSKFHSHSFMCTTLADFKKKISKFQGTYLYLTVCQYANRVNLEIHQKIVLKTLQEEDYAYLKRVLFKCERKNINSISNQQVNAILKKNKENLRDLLKSQAENFLYIMQKHNNLKQNAFDECLLYSKMHNLLVRHQIVKKQTTIVDLMMISHSSLIASFFLGNRQRDQQLFHEFMAIYPNKQHFYIALNEFIESSNCSRVELQILYNELRRRNGPQFVEQNNRLTKLLIYGFCLRTQIRERLQANTFIEMFKSIFVQFQQIIKFQKIIIMNDELSHVLEFFMCEKLSYEKVLNEPKQLITMMLQNYFNGNLNFEVLDIQYDQYQSKTQKQIQTENFLKSQTALLYIENEQFCMDRISNTFYVISHIKQKLYMDWSQKEYCLVYGKLLIEWSQFNILKEIFSQNNSQLKLKELTIKEYFLQLIYQVLEEIYKSDTIFMDGLTIVHIEEVLSLLDENPDLPLIVSERSKLQLCRILQKWNYQLKAAMLEQMCIKWKDDQQQLMMEFIDHCIDYLDLDQLLNLYRLFEATRLGVYIQETRDDHSIRYAYELANKLMKRQNNHEKDEIISKIIHFINKGEKRYKVEFGLMGETFLRIIVRKYGQYPSYEADEVDHDNLHRSHKLTVSSKKADTQRIAYHNKTPSILSINPHNYNSDLNRSNDNIAKRNSTISQSKQHYRGKPVANKSNNNVSEMIKFDDVSIPQRIFNLWRNNDGKAFVPKILSGKSPSLYTNIKCLNSSSNITRGLKRIRPEHEKGRRLIEHVIMNWEHIGLINEMFRDCFSGEGWDEHHYNDFIIHHQIIIKKANQYQIDSGEEMIKCDNFHNSYAHDKFIMKFNTLWQISKRVSESYLNFYIQILKNDIERCISSLYKKFTSLLFNNYFFLVMMFKRPSTLKKIKLINYEHFLLLELMKQVQQSIENDNILVKCVDFALIWIYFQEGIKKILIMKIQQLENNLQILFDVQLCTLQQIVNQLGKNGRHLLLYIKILSQIVNYRKLYEHGNIQQSNKSKQLLKSQFIEHQIHQQVNRQANQSKRQSLMTFKQIEELKISYFETTKELSQDPMRLMQSIGKAIEELVSEKMNSKENIEISNLQILQKIKSKSQIPTSFQVIGGGFSQSQIIDRIEQNKNYNSQGKKV